MAYNQPGVRVRQEIAESELIPVESEMPTCIVGPLFQVINDGLCLNSLDPLSAADPTIPWKLADGTDIPVGSVVDLSSVNNQLIDSQRKVLYDVVASFQLKDKTTGQVTAVPDSEVYGLSTSGFKLNVANTRVSRSTVDDVFLVPVDGENKFYAPGGGFLSLFPDDRFQFNANEFTVNTIVDDRKLTTDESTLGIAAASGTFFPNDHEASSGGLIASTPTGGSSRLTGFSGVAGISVGDVAVTGIDVVGFSGLTQNSPQSVNSLTANDVSDNGDDTATVAFDANNFNTILGLGVKSGSLMTFEANGQTHGPYLVKSVNDISLSFVLYSADAPSFEANHILVDATLEQVNNRTCVAFTTLQSAATNNLADSTVDNTIQINGVTIASVASAASATNYALIVNVPFSQNALNDEFTGQYLELIQDNGEARYVKVIEVSVAEGKILVEVLDSDPGYMNEIGPLQTATVTIMRSQLGFVTAVDSSENTVTVSNDEQTISANSTFVEIFSSTEANNVEAFAPVQVESTFRILRRDLAGNVYSAQTPSELNDVVGDGYSADHRDGLGWAVRLAAIAQPTESRVYFIPVDLFPDAVAPDGLPESWDVGTGYTNALEVAGTVDVYNVVPLNNSATVRSALLNHVSTMSSVTEGMERRGFVVVDVPLGSTESSTGQVTPGFDASGVWTGNSPGNKVIKDANVQFSQAGVTAGTKVVVTFPQELAGIYIATGDTTDVELHLDDEPWSLAKEFDFDDASISTSSGVHTISGIDTSHVQIGDYIHIKSLAPATPGGLAEATYVFRVTSVLNATSVTAVDEAPGTLTFSDNALLGYVVRSWGYQDGAQSIGPNVEYYIKPLSKTEQITALAALQTFQSRRITAMISQAPTLETALSSTAGVPLQATVAPEYTAVAVAAKRSGLQSNEEVTNLTLQGGIVLCNYAVGYFSRGQMNQLAEAGYTLIEQKTVSSDPFVRDMITSATGAGLVSSEEIVTANADWQAKTLRATFVSKPGAKLPLLTPRLIGIRTMQIDAILNNWLNQNPQRLLAYQIAKVGKNTTNPRQLDIGYVAVFPLAEKEIEFVMELSVGE